MQGSCKTDKTMFHYLTLSTLIITVTKTKFNTYSNIVLNKAMEYLTLHFSSLSYQRLEVIIANVTLNVAAPNNNLILYLNQSTNLFFFNSSSPSSSFPIYFSLNYQL